MSDSHPIRRGAFGRGLAVSLAGARAGGAIAVDSALRRFRGKSAAESPAVRREALRFAQRLGELKGTYVKVGQMFALLGEHFLPAALTDALHDLESRTRPLDWAHIQPVMAAALGEALPELEVDTRALAAASLAQVHRARIRASGTDIVLKVQYPDLESVIDDDFDAVVRMLRLARWIPAGRDFDKWLGAMRSQLHDEIDYRREQVMAERLGGLARSLNRPGAEVAVAVPTYHPDYCADTVLAIDYVDGLAVTDASVQQLPQAQRNALARVMLELFFCEVFDWGLMQVDPNFGNYLISRDGTTLTLLDFGSVLELEPSFRRALGDAIIAGQVDDRDALVDALVRLGCLRNDSSEQAVRTFAGFVRHILEPLRPPEALPAEYLNGAGHYRWRESQLMTRAGKQAAGSAASRHFAIPSEEFALIVRKLTGVFTFIAVLGAEFNACDLLQPHVDRWRSS